jgi:hypothetical protein
MTRVDPNVPPDPEIWSALDDTERIDLVTAHHRQARFPVSDTDGLHVGMHVGIEDQIALGGWTEISQTLSRLMNDGIDRHEAIHAISNVLMGIAINVVAEDGGRVDIRAKYGNELATITAASWRARQ